MIHMLVKGYQAIPPSQEQPHLCNILQSISINYQLYQDFQRHVFQMA